MPLRSKSKLLTCALTLESTVVTAISPEVYYALAANVLFVAIAAIVISSKARDSRSRAIRWSATGFLVTGGLYVLNSLRREIVAGLAKLAPESSIDGRLQALVLAGVAVAAIVHFKRSGSQNFRPLFRRLGLVLSP